MQKSGVLFLFVFLFVASILISGVIHAQEEVYREEDIGAGVEDEFLEFAPEEFLEGEFDEEIGELVREAEGFDEELEVDAGTVPGSIFYGVDEFFDRFADEGKVREEKIAEMKVVAEGCGQGDQKACDNLQVAFESYKKHADEFEREVAPEEREEAKRSSEAIRGTLIREIAKDIPPTLKDEYVREIIGKEADIATSAEIAFKIKELCEALSELDPLEYSRVCRTKDDAPDWHRKLDSDLTGEQERVAKEFFKIMSQCIETSGRDCNCAGIPVPAFADLCAEVAPLEAMCDDDSIPEEEAEAVCDKVDALTRGY
ncbi:MAG: hypothetical protein IIA87_00290 [Nanoarchaeota archaeon]|nr:hypothetical protein [Nanoarchaeota archaeon]